jgi:hypothetical protein
MWVSFYSERRAQLMFIATTGDGLALQTEWLPALLSDGSRVTETTQRPSGNVIQSAGIRSVHDSCRGELGELGKLGELGDGLIVC